jgi:tRNA (guanine-N7-)-methyltransferase
MSRKKNIRFKEIEQNSNVIQEGKPLFRSIKGRWLSDFFKNDNPIILELGCGKGEYTVGLAKLFPNKNFIGIDIKGDRIAVGSNQALEYSLNNVAFLRTKVHDIEIFFGENEVNEIWITFPDPHSLHSGIRRRMTNQRFLEIYKKILKDEGLLHLKTDNEPFFDYSIDSLSNFGVHEFVFTKNLYSSEFNKRHYGIKTRFEEKFTAKGFNINYLSCQFYPSKKAS